MLGAYSDKSTARSHSMTRWLVQTATWLGKGLAGSSGTDRLCKHVALYSFRRSTCNLNRFFKTTLEPNAMSYLANKKRTWIPRRMQIRWSKLVTLRWEQRSSTVNRWSIRPSTLDSRNASLYWGKPISSSQRTVHWWSNLPALVNSSAINQTRDSIIP